MGWSAAWLAARARGEGERRRLRALRLGGPDAVDQVEWTVDDLGSDVGGLHLAADGLEVAGQRVQVGSWTSSIGAFRVTLAGDVSGLRQVVWRGQPVVYEIGYPSAGWEPVALGVVADLERPSMREPRWIMTCRDLVGALESRLVESSARWALFAGLTPRRVPPPLASAYGTSDTTIEINRAHTVREVLGFEFETGRPGAVVMRPETDEAFFRTYTGTSAGGSGEIILTGVSTVSTLWRTTSRATSVARSESTGGVVPAALLTGHPLRVALRILASTGTGENGPDDVYPASWGYGIPHELIDREDALAWMRAVHDDSVSDRSQWQMIVTEPQPDGLSWLAGELARVGMWLTVRQGRITVRGAWAVQDPAVPPPPAYGRLSEYDLVRSLGYREWTGGVEAEAYRQVVRYAYTQPVALVDPLRGRPSVETVETDVSDWLREPGDAPSQEYPDAELLARRLASWSLRSAKAITSETAHPAAPGLACGDPVVLDEGVVHGAYDDAGLRGRAAMVVSVDVDWQGGTTRVQLAVPGVADAPGVDSDYDDEPEDAPAVEEA